MIVVKGGLMVEHRCAALDFELGDHDPDECVFGWKSIGNILGYNERTLRRYLSTLRIQLPRWGFGGQTGAASESRQPCRRYRRYRSFRACGARGLLPARALRPGTRLLARWGCGWRGWAVAPGGGGPARGRFGCGEKVGTAAIPHIQSYAQRRVRGSGGVHGRQYGWRRSGRVKRRLAFLRRAG